MTAGRGWLLFGHTILDDRGTVAGKVGEAPASKEDTERVVVDRGRVSRFTAGAKPAIQFVSLPGKGE